MKDEKHLLREHADIMRSFAKGYINSLLGKDSSSSPRITDLAIKDIEDLINNTQNEEIKIGFIKTLEMLTHLNKFNMNLIPQWSEYHRDEKNSYWNHPIIFGLSALQDLMNTSGTSKGGCGDAGIKISESESYGANPCREGQYRAISASDKLKIGNLQDELPKNVINLSNALDAYTEQCLHCPYKSFRDAKKK